MGGGVCLVRRGGAGVLSVSVASRLVKESKAITFQISLTVRSVTFGCV